MRCCVFLMLLTFVVSAGCNSGERETKTTNAAAGSSSRNNYIILLDISDRISIGGQQQVTKDIAVVKSIYHVFKNNLAAKDSTGLYTGLDDKLKLLAAPNWLCAGIDLSAEPSARKALLADKTEKLFNNSLPEIYQAAITGNANAAGSDIWQYFNNSLSNDVDKDAQNTLFIITDGYLAPKKTGEQPAQKNRYPSGTILIDTLKKYPDWEARFTQGDYGFLPVAKKFTALQVIVLQVNPREGWSSEYNLLTKTWGKWLTEMGISNYHFIKNDSSAQVAASLAALMHVQVGAATARQITTINTRDSISNEPASARRSDTAKTIVTTKETAVKISKPPVRISPEKTVPAVSKPKIFATPEVAPPDESDTQLLNTRKAKIPARKIAGKDEEDILQDGGAANGFNTGIKKDVKKKNP